MYEWSEHGGLSYNNSYPYNFLLTYNKIEDIKYFHSSTKICVREQDKFQSPRHIDMRVLTSTRPRVSFTTVTTVPFHTTADQTPIHAKKESVEADKTLNELKRVRAPNDTTGSKET